MAPGGEMFRYPQHFGENVLHHGSHEWLPYSKDEVRLKTVNNNLSANTSFSERGRVSRKREHILNTTRIITDKSWRIQCFSGRTD